MRVLHVAWEYPPVVYGGLGRHVGALVAAQRALGHDVRVLTHGPGDEAGVLRIPTPELPLEASTLMAWVEEFQTALIAAAGPWLDGWDPDVVHGHDWMVGRVVLSLAERCPSVVTFHATEAGRHQGWLPDALAREVHSAEWSLAHRADGLITCSTHMAREVCAALGQDLSRITVVPNGIDLSEWERPDAAHEADLIVSAGRLEWEKGFHTLIEAVSRLERDVRLVIAGTGSKRAELEHLAARLGVAERVTFLGWVQDLALRETMARGAVCVLPSIYEPFGMIALEAAAMGTPLVVGRTGGLAEFVHDERNGLSFAPGDAADLAACLERMLSDLDFARSCATRAHEALPDYQWNSIAQRTLEVYTRTQVGAGSEPDRCPQFEGDLLEGMRPRA